MTPEEQVDASYGPPVTANDIARFEQNRLLAAMMRRLIAQSRDVFAGENWLNFVANLDISDEEQACLVTIIEEGQ